MKKQLFFILALLLFTATSVWADFTSGDYTYTVSGGNATITEYTGAGGAISIPSTLDGYTVTGIGYAAFNPSFGPNTTITSITIPISVTTIGDYAFVECYNLTSVNIPTGLTSISEGTFADCLGLNSITIPAGVTSIGVQAFQSCQTFTSVTIPASVTSIGSQAFSDCYALTKVYFLGNAPTMGGDVFFQNPTTVYYFCDKTGFTTPTWLPEAYPTECTADLPVKVMRLGAYIAGYSAIQDAIDASTTLAGDVIEVYPGEYDEFINIDKSLTLNAILPNPSVDWLDILETIDISADNVTINGFSTVWPLGPDYAIKVHSGFSGYNISNIGIIYNDDAWNPNSVGIWIEAGAGGGTIQGITFQDNAKGIYIAGDLTGVLKIKGNNMGYPTGSGNHKCDIENNADNVEITDGNIFNFKYSPDAMNPLRIKNFGDNVKIIGNVFNNIQNGGTAISNTGTGVTVNMNSFGGTVMTKTAISSTVALDARSNWYGSAKGPNNLANNPCGDGWTVSVNVAFIPWFTDFAMTGTADGNLAVHNVNQGTYYCTIQAAINAANPLGGDVIEIAAGTYNEDITINKSITLHGAGYNSTTVIGPIGGTSATMQVGAPNVVIDGFKITRDGNNSTDWNNAGLNSAGIAVQGLTNFAEIKNNKITGMRTAIDINSSNGNNIHNNIIDDNRTGLIFRNQTDNTNCVNNEITNNWTVGVLFLDASGGTNSPVQSALNSTFNNNKISGNWYGQIVDRQVGGSLPAPGTTNMKNFTCNWYGTSTPTYSVANSTEPGYAAQIPVEFPGGTATPPGGQPDILGLAAANFNYTPYNISDGGACAGGSPVLVVRAGIIISGHSTIQAGIDAAIAGDIVKVYPGNYNETAPNSSFNGGTYQFGLFFASTKSDITVQGCKTDGSPVTNTADIAAFITTNATNTFGYSGTLVAGNNITISGLEFGSNAAGDDKAIEVVGNGFAINACRLTANAPIYIGDYNYNESGTLGDFSDDISSIQSYTISNCHFAGATSIGGVYIANGAGWTGNDPSLVTGRSITGCIFDGMTTLAFAGLSPGYGWLLYPTGAATVTGNTFTNAANTRYIQSWGVVQAQFPYASYFNDNTFPKKVITTTDGNANNVRGYDASSAYLNLKRIGTVIQPRITNAVPGDVILVGAGTYNENVTIDRRITLNGAGATTIISSAAATNPVITITASGDNATDRLVVSNLKVTGATGLENPGAGILVQSTTASGYYTFSGVEASGNQGSGIAFNSTANVTDVKILNNCLLSNNGFGLRIATAVPSFDGLTVTDCQMNNNASSAFTYNPSGTLTNVGTNFIFTDCGFSNNSQAGVANQHDLSFFGFHGNATLTNVNVTTSNGPSTTHKAYGILFTNASAYAAAGTITLNGVNVTGVVGKGALSFQLYNDMSNVSLTGVDVSACTAPWGQVIIDQQGTGTFNLGNTTLKSLVLWNAANVNATTANFKHITTGVALNKAILADCYQIENQIAHKIDLSTLGLVRIKTGELFVTPASFASPYTTTPSIQRGVDAATANDIVNVDAGIYNEYNINISKALTLKGANADIPLGSRGSESKIQDLTGSGTALINTLSDGITINGFELTSTGANNAIYCGNDGPGNLNIEFNNIHDIGTARGSGNVYAINYRVNNPSPSNVNISDNIFNEVFNATSAALGHSAAIWLGQSTANGTVSNLTIERNTISNVKTGLSSKEATGIYIGVAWGAGTGKVQSPVIRYNSITDIKGGIAYAIQLSGKTPGAVVSNNTINNIINLTTPSTAAIGVAIPSTNTGSATISVNNNSLTNVLYAITNGTTNTVNATCNWYGTTLSSEIASKIYGNVTYVPYRISDGGACEGGPVVVNHALGGTHIYAAIQPAINASTTLPGDVINVAAGIYLEDVNISKSITLHGENMNTTIIKGLKTTGSAGQTLFMGANNITLEGFTITRDGNNTTDWNTTPKTSGIAFGQLLNGCVIQNCVVTGNRNGIYLNNTQSHIIRNNLITFNRTGVQLVNDVSNCLIEHNTITDNWTVGFVIYYASTGMPASTNVVVNYNDISGNWYSQVDCKTSQPNPSLLYDFTKNWFGSACLNITTSPAGEPGYAAQIPALFTGGTATNPGGNNGKISGDLVAKVSYIPWYSDAAMTTLAYPTPAPTGPATQSYCSAEGKTVANLAATLTGTAINWYSAASGGILYIGTELLVTGSYFASQTIGGCESVDRKEVAVTITTTVTTTFAQLGPYCQGALAGALLTSSNNTPPVTGAWIDGPITTSTAGTKVYHFTPDAGQCATTANMSILVNATVVPTFYAFPPYEVGATPALLPGTSNNGITGTWNPDPINTSSAGIFPYTFTPNAGLCTVSTTVNITIYETSLFQVSQDIGTTLFLSWPAVSGAARYSIYYRPLLSPPGGSWVGNSVSYPFIKAVNLTPGTVYECKYQAYYSSGVAIWWGVASGTFTPAHVAFEKKSDIGTTCQIDWDDWSSWASSYVFQFKSGTNWIPMVRYANNGKASNMTPGVTYQCRVVAYRNGSLWGTSEIFDFTPQPVVFTLGSHTNTTCNISWNSMAPWATSRSFYYRPLTSPPSGNWIGNTTNLNDNIHLIGLTPNIPYECKLGVYISSIWGETLPGQFTLTAKSNEGGSNVVNNDINVYPNPFIDQVNMDAFAKDETKITWNIYDMTGKVVLSGSESINSGYSTLDIDATGLSKGVYMLNTMLDDQMHSFRIMKQ